jgi:hypothetical protein
MTKLQFIRMYVHQRDKYEYTRQRTCSEISKWVGLPPYKVSRIAQKAIQLGFIAKEGRVLCPEGWKASCAVAVKQPPLGLK